VFVTIATKGNDGNRCDQIYELIQELFTEITNIKVPVFFIQKFGNQMYTPCSEFINVNQCDNSIWKESCNDEMSLISGSSVGGLVTIIGWYHIRVGN